MITATTCPYCNKEISEAIYEDWLGEYCDEYEFTCPKCGEKIDITVVAEPLFLLRKNIMR